MSYIDSAAETPATVVQAALMASRNAAALLPRLEHEPLGLLLDAGDTLVFLDTVAVHHVLLEQGVRIDAERIQRAVPEAKRVYERTVLRGSTHDDAWYCLMSTMLEAAGVEPARLEDLTRTVRAAHDEFNLWRRVPEDVPGALARARDAGLRVGVVSNSEGQLKELLTRVQLWPLFDLVVDSALEGVRKPDPEIFHRALSRLKLPAERTLYAGDLPQVDVQGARAAGLTPILVDPWGLHDELVDVIRVRSVTELIDALILV